MGGGPGPKTMVLVASGMDDELGGGCWSNWTGGGCCSWYLPLSNTLLTRSGIWPANGCLGVTFTDGMPVAIDRISDGVGEFVCHKFEA